jgi:hypothetical protein
VYVVRRAGGAEQHADVHLAQSTRGTGLWVLHAESRRRIAAKRKNPVVTKAAAAFCILHLVVRIKAVRIVCLVIQSTRPEARSPNRS